MEMNRVSWLAYASWLWSYFMSKPGISALVVLSVALLVGACKKGATDSTQGEAPILPDVLWAPAQGPPFGSMVEDFVFGPNGH